VNVLLTAAGAGSRFQRAGVTTPKPLIRVQGQALLLHALDSFPLAPGDRLVLGVQRRHGVREQLEGTLAGRWPGVAITWVELDELLAGQLATAAFCVSRALANDRRALADPLLIHNCDTGFAWPEEGGGSLLAEEAYGSMAVFPAEGEHWSFGRPDPADPGRAVEIREKRRISPLASIGLYGFRSGEQFLADALPWLQEAEPLGGEHYVAPLLQGALERGQTVRLPRVNGVRLFGTPAELCATFGVGLEDLLRQNEPTEPGDGDGD
jgi:NDP-sugar pyrophosphorylase family protein